jgi:hypothetical protein
MRSAHLARAVLAGSGIWTRLEKAHLTTQRLDYRNIRNSSSSPYRKHGRFKRGLPASPRPTMIDLSRPADSPPSLTPSAPCAPRLSAARRRRAPAAPPRRRLRHRRRHFRPSSPPPRRLARAQAAPQRAAQREFKPCRPGNVRARADQGVGPAEGLIEHGGRGPAAESGQRQRLGQGRGKRRPRSAVEGGGGGLGGDGTRAGPGRPEQPAGSRGQQAARCCGGGSAGSRAGPASAP